MTLSCLNHVKRSIKGNRSRPPPPPAYTVIEVIYDRSGSMVTIDAVARAGLIKFIKSHKKMAKSSLTKTSLSLTTFDTKATTYYNDVDLATLAPFTHGEMVRMTRPRDQTRLVDTLYERFLAINRKIDSMVSGIPREVRNLRPKIVAIVLCITDGYDNASPLHTKAQLGELVDRSESKGIDVIFMGANQDAIATAKEFHINEGHALTFGATANTATAAWQAATQNTLFAVSGRGGSAPQRCNARATSSAPAFTPLQRAVSQPGYAGALSDDDDDDDAMAVVPRRVPRVPRHPRHRPVWAMGGGGNPRSQTCTQASPRGHPAQVVVPIQGLSIMQSRVPPRVQRRRMNTVQAYNK